MERISTTTHQEAIAKAAASIERARGSREADPHRPAYHARPPVHWMNDPNGLIHYKGKYHLFYQHNPYGAQWGDIHWGHMSSADLVHWEHLPIALAPSEAYDRDGCFSGSAVEHEGRLHLFYTGNLFTTPVGVPDDLLQQQCVAVSEDGIHFEKSARNPIIPAPPPEVGQNTHFRDPKVWKHGKRWHMVVGVRMNDTGKVVMYRSPDLIDWEFAGVIAESDGTMGYMHECPDFFSLGGKDVLLLSPEGASAVDGERTSGYYVGQLDYESVRYEHGLFQRLDYGFDFYAPQTLTDPCGRRILIGWMPMDGAGLGKQWAGCMTIPRELTLHSDTNRLLIRPAAEMKLLRSAPRSAGPFAVRDRELHTIPGIAGECIELLVEYDLAATDAAEFGLHVRVSADGAEKTVIAYHAHTGQMVFDRTDAGEGVAGMKACAIASGGSPDILTLHLFLDRSTLELFINDGEYVMSGYIFPAAASRGIEFFAAGGTAAVRRVQCWDMDAAVE